MSSKAACAKPAARVRITGQLIDASSGAHLWADRFDGDLEDVFDLQDRITTSVVASIGPKLEQAEIERAKRKPTESLDAYDYYLRGMATFYQRTNEANSAARAIVQEGDRTRPGIRHGARDGRVVHRMAQAEWLDGRPRARERGSRAIGAAGRGVGGRRPSRPDAGGHTLGVLLDDLETAVTLIDRALALNPNYALAWALGGWMRACLGEPEAAMERHARAMRLSPLDPDLSQMQCGMGFALLMLGRYDDASAWGEKAYRGQPNFLAAAALTAGSHALAGRTEESRPAMERVRLIDPSLRLSNLKDWFPFEARKTPPLWSRECERPGCRSDWRRHTPVSMGSLPCAIRWPSLYPTMFVLGREYFVVSM